MPDTKRISHLIPQVGEVKLELYDPADALLAWLDKHKERQRLSRLRHSGVIAEVLRGMAHYRWDYTVAMLYFASRISAAGLRSKFRIGRCHFSSQVAALQSMALVWNIGHLPGTYPVEKGVHRFLTSNNPGNPAGGLAWPASTWYDRDSVIRAANSLLKRDDYLGVARVLASLKLVLNAEASGEQQELVSDFLVPFLIENDSDSSMQWAKLRRCFGLIRHLSYLTIDSVYAGATWSPNIALLIEDLRRDDSPSIDLVADELSEILSPVERQTFSRLYHSDKAKAEAARHACHVAKVLEDHPTPFDAVRTWSFKGLKGDLKLGKILRREKLQHVGSLVLRSHFSGHEYSPSELEGRLVSRGFSHPVVFRYKSWNSDVLLEPDELTVDVYQDQPVSAKHVGKLILWVMRRFDDLSAEPGDFFGRVIKIELAESYRSMIRSAVELRFPGVTLDVQPWPLERFGIFEDSATGPGRTSVWACASKLDDQFTRHILRDRTRSVRTELRDLYNELSGIRELRTLLRKRWRKTTPRQRWLMATGSVRLMDDTKILAEFDGGLIKISARSGDITWYGLEAKKGRRGAVRALNKKLRVLGLPETAEKVGTSAFSFATIKL